MEAKSEYAAMNYVNVGPEKKSFTIRLHKECLFSWCEARMVAQKANRVRKEWSREPRVGRVPTNTTPEQLKFRKKIQFYLHDSKMVLIKAYTNRDEEQIRKTWLRMAKWLTVYGDESQLGRTTRYRLGSEAMEAISVGGDAEFIPVLAEADGDPVQMAEIIRGKFGE